MGGFQPVMLLLVPLLSAVTLFLGVLAILWPGRVRLRCRARRDFRAVGRMNGRQARMTRGVLVILAAGALSGCRGDRPSSHDCYAAWNAGPRVNHDLAAR